MANHHSKDRPFGFRSVFARLFISIFLVIAVFAVAMFSWMQVVHNHSDTLKNRTIARQIVSQISPFLQKVNDDLREGNRLQARFSLVVVKKIFDIFDESLGAKIGLYDANKRLILQTNDSNLPKKLLYESGWFSETMPSIWETPKTHVQIKTATGFTLWYESRNPSHISRFAGVFNVFTGTVLLFLVMTAVLWLIAKNITKRLNDLSWHMARMGEGDFSSRLIPKGKDEIAFLARGFNQAAHKIEQLINANNLLLAHASHEFRTPITRMRLQTEMLAMLGDSLGEAQKTQLDKRLRAINADLTGLNDLIESILLVSRLDAGHALEQKQYFDFFEIIAQECQHFSQVQLFGDSLSLIGQPKLITHLIRNLLNNAIIHGKAPVRVYVYGCQNPQDAATIPDALTAHTLPAMPSDSPNTDAPKDKGSKSLLSRFKKPSSPAESTWAVLAVVDAGTGIAPDKRSDIFSPFVRLKQEKKGSGLGLSLVAQIVAAHAGTIRTDTWQGCTRFLVLLPNQQ